MNTHKKTNLFLLIAIVLVFAAGSMISGCSSNSDGGGGNVPQVTLTSIAVTPVNPTIAKGETQAFAAKGTYSDGSTKTITGDVTWASSDDEVATINDAGLATGVKGGEVEITATLSGKTGTATLTVTDKTLESVSISPATATIGVGEEKPLTATAHYSDGTNQAVTSQATWTTSASNKVEFTDTKGEVIGIAEGSATITASFGGKQGSATITVSSSAPKTLQSITIEPSSLDVPVDIFYQLKAFGHYSNGDVEELTGNAFAWYSDNNDVAMFDPLGGRAGELETISAGETKVHFAVGGINGEATVKVSEKTLTGLTVTPNSDPLNIPQNTSVTFKAEATYEGDDEKYDVTRATGWALDGAVPAGTDWDNPIGSTPSKLKAGTTAGGPFTVRATYGDQIVELTNVNVPEASLESVTITPPKGASNTLPYDNSVGAMQIQQQYTATAKFSNGQEQDVTADVAWFSTQTGVATVQTVGDPNPGLLTVVKNGATVLKVTTLDPISGDPVTGELTVTVKEAQLNTITVSPNDGNDNDARTYMPLDVAGTDVTRQYKAVGNFQNEVTFNLTNIVTWSVERATAEDPPLDPGTITEGGLYTPAAGGNVKIKAATPVEYGVPAGTSTVEVIDGDKGIAARNVDAELVNFNDPTLPAVGFEITPRTFALFVGKTKQLKVVGRYRQNQADGNKKDYYYNITSFMTYTPQAGADIPTVTVTQAGLVTAEAGKGQNHIAIEKQALADEAVVTVNNDN